MKTIPLKSESGQGRPLLPPLFYIILEILNTAIRQWKDIEASKVGKKSKDFSICRWYGTIYTENPKITTLKKSQLVSEFSKFVTHKTNIHKSVAFLYTKIKKNKIPGNKLNQRGKWPFLWKL